MPVTAKEVAGAIGIHENTLNKIENGKTKGIEFDTLAALCSFYGVGVGDLLEYDPNGRLALTLPAAVSLAG
ncbi:MAG: helix-turn-helix domain-containing protein [Kouleothrix sp.]|nr:helix-turn-helix domain-containing protein [Kouleothrix sp.]